MNVSGKTRIVGIFGSPIEHTLSPAMHNAAFAKMGLDMFYLAFHVSAQDLSDALQSIKALKMAGVNITVPHKENVIPLLDRVDEEAAFIGAVNTVVLSEGTLTGYNTDGRGFMSSLSEGGISVDGKNVCIIGAGGAARAISYYVSDRASRLSLFDINMAKAEKLVHDLSTIRSNVFYQTIDDMKNPDVVINATPLGMRQEDPLPVKPEFITPDMTVCDLVYKNTKLLQVAADKGAKTLDGSGMLLWQGVLAFELWTGVKPPVDVMRDALNVGVRSSHYT
jgi:shikimate dehydrogenase